MSHDPREPTSGAAEPEAPAPAPEEAAPAVDAEPAEAAEPERTSEVWVPHEELVPRPWLWELFVRMDRNGYTTHGHAGHSLLASQATEQ